LDEGLFCIGCGARIQIDKKDEAGWLPKTALEKYLNSDDEEAELLCNRCFRLRNYNEIQPVELNSDHFTKLLNSIGSKNALVVYVVDLFDVTGSLISGLSLSIGKNPVLMVGNKLDILPKSVKENKIKQWLMGEAKELGINVEDVILTRATKGDTGEQIVNQLQTYLKYHEIYVVGVTNVGKSTLINQVVKYVEGVGNVITTSRFPGTTLDQIEIPLDEEHKIIDTPGIIHDWQMAHYIEDKNLKYLLPNKEIKPKTYQLQTGQTIFLGGLAWIDFENQESISATAYFENNLNQHRTKTQTASDFYQKHAGALLVPIPTTTEFEIRTLNIEKGEDVVIAGLGWFALNNKTQVTVHVPKGVSVTSRKSEI
jgi:ribosome biogenesis GTPase YqeH